MIELIAAAVSGAVVGGGVMDWQPIETIDLEMFRDDWELRVLTFDDEGDILLSFYSFPDEGDDDGLEGYWSGGDGVSEFPDTQPTHWMPLPPPPTV